MDNLELKPILEAMIFVADEPMTENALAIALADAGIEKSQIRECLLTIETEWNTDQSRGVGLIQVAGGYQFRTKTGYADWLKRLNVPKPMRLSAQAAETLAIVAYRQPIVRSELERIRGVDSGGVLKTLLDRRLLRIVGRQDEPGQPLLYGTTKEFLEVFNLKALAELPTLKDIEELMRERRTITEEQNSSPSELFLSGTTPDDVEEQTELIEGDDEEETEIIKRHKLEEDEENKDEEKDIEALTSLEKSLKDLRRLEHSIFPKNFLEDSEVKAEGGQDAGEKPDNQQNKPAESGEVSATKEGSDAPSTNDSSFE